MINMERVEKLISAVAFDDCCVRCPLYFDNFCPRWKNETSMTDEACEEILRKWISTLDN